MSPRMFRSSSLVVAFATLTFLGPAVVFGARWPYSARDGRSVAEDMGVPASFDCGMRKLAYSYGKQLLPRMGSFESLYYALGLNIDCNDTELSAAPSQPNRLYSPPSSAAPKFDMNTAVVVAPWGSSGAPGTAEHPLADLKAAVALALQKDSVSPTVVRNSHSYRASS